MQNEHDAPFLLKRLFLKEDNRFFSYELLVRCCGTLEWMLLGFIFLSISLVTADSDTFLFLGDSHTVGSFGARLDELLREEAPRVVTYGVCGASPSWWFEGTKTRCGYFFHEADSDATRGMRVKTPLISRLLEEWNPSVVIVALGANLISESNASVSESSAKLAHVSVSLGARCVWVGPPHGRNKPEPRFSEFYSVLKEAVSQNCEFIDSRPYAHYPDVGGDGVHFDSLGPEGVALARAWAEAVFLQLLEVLDT